METNALFSKELQFKDLSEIADNISEEEYRKNPALSYSLLSKYEREGFDNLSKLYDREESSSLLLGSLVDTLITDSNNFFKKYVVVEYKELSDTILRMVKEVLSHGNYGELKDVPKCILEDTFNKYQWQSNWKLDTKIYKFVEAASDYYKIFSNIPEGVVPVSRSIYETANKCVEALKTSGYSKHFFEQDDPFSFDIRRYYQLKFHATLDGIDFKCMPDLLIVFHKEKVIVPIDLKTSSKQEWNFPKSFLYWNYSIQARLYYRILRECLNKDSYFKDFTLKNWHFIVVNERTLTPLVWEDENTTVVGDIETKKGNILRDPFTIAKELNIYLNNPCRFPIGITNTKANKLCDFI